MAEIYCFICGGDPKVKNVLHHALQAHATAMQAAPPSDQALFPLEFGPDDIAFQTNLCLVGPLHPMNNDQLFDPVNDDPKAIAAIDLRTVRMILNLVPASTDDFGLILDKTTQTPFAVTGNTYPFAHSGCMNILCGRLIARGYTRPDLAFWAIVRRRNLRSHATTGINDIMYGREIENTHARSIVGTVPLENLRRTAHGVQVLDSGVKAATAGHIPQGLLYEYWMGCGAMWVHATPSSFPFNLAATNPFQLKNHPPRIEGMSALERLPVELLVIIAQKLSGLTDLATLLSLSKTVRYRVAAHVDPIVRVILPEWMVPPPEYRPKWRFPWLKYAHACMRFSPSMRNRRRIWNICEQIVRFADAMTPAELGQPTEPRNSQMRPS